MATRNEPVVIDKFVGLVDKRAFAGASVGALREVSNLVVTDDEKLETRLGMDNIAGLSGVVRVVQHNNELYAVTTTGTYMVASGVATLISQFSAHGYVAFASTPSGAVLSNGVAGIVINGGVAIDWVGTEVGTAESNTVPVFDDVQLQGLPAQAGTSDLAYDNGVLVEIIDGAAVHSFAYSIYTMDVDEFIHVGTDAEALGRIGDHTVIGAKDGVYIYGGGTLRKVTPDRMLRGSFVRTSGDRVGVSGKAGVFSTTGGICIVTDTGEYRELTHDRVSWFDTDYASAAVVNMNGSWQYVLGLNSPVAVRQANQPAQHVVR